MSILKKTIKKAILKVLKPYNIRYVSPQEQKVLKKIHTAQKGVISATKKTVDVPVSDSKSNLDRIKKYLDGFDKEHIWAFNSGNSGEAFRGNPKYLFAYINNYRSDIKAYWISQNQEVIDQVKNLGFEAVLSDSPEAAYATKRTGVAVSEQARGVFPFSDDTKYLNLWHGMGYKKTERTRIEDDDDLRMSLAPKYVANNPIYLNQMLLAVTCRMQEEQFYKDFQISADHMLRVGYARCTYQQKYKPVVTFEHDILAQKGLSADTKIAVYAPTFRNQRGNTFAEAFEDIDRLYEKCEQNNILLIFKMHPLMEQETGFLNAKSKFGDRPYFLFWDNNNDIYEIMDKIHLLIYDYSSIFSDFLIAGVKHYVRYIYDMEKMIEEGSFESVDEYYSRTAGLICSNYDELLSSFDTYEESYNKELLDNIYQMQWEYAGDDDFEKTIQSTLDFEVAKTEYPILYSFDIFDTLISREGLDPLSIFYAVRERIIADGTYPVDILKRYPTLRHNAEFNAREYMNKSVDSRGSFHVEITLKQIYERLQTVYNLTDEQTEKLMNWEIEEEIKASIPLKEQIDLVKKYKSEGNTVILISDMYLPKEVIQKMLAKADPLLAELPLYLSNEYGVLKTSKLLFFEVYRTIKPFYNFGKWIHYGDNTNADQKQPRGFGIKTRLIQKPSFTAVQKNQVNQLQNYDGYKLAAMEARLLQENPFEKANFVVDFIAPIFVSYIDWVLRDALDRGFETLYFVSRDGHPLKRIADAIIKVHNWPIKTKYIYASRRVWRVPSYINEIDVDFWSNQGGNFNDIKSKEKFLNALNIDDEDTFKQILPEIDIENVDFLDWSNGQPARNIAQIIKNTKSYTDYLLNRAAEERVIVCDYLKQEVDNSEKHAFVEFWGRGYNQTCHSRLWNHALGHEEPLYYYYARSVQPSEGNCVRINFTTNLVDLIAIESIFANMPYKSIEKYEYRDGRIEPVIEPIICDVPLFNAMEKLLPEYAKRFAELNLDDPITVDRALIDITLDYYNSHKSSPFIYNNIGNLMDGVSMYSTKMQLARPYTTDDLENFANGIPRGRGTRSITMSYLRSPLEVRTVYDEMFQIMDGSDVAGGTLLKPSEIKKNREFEGKVERSTARAEAFQGFYNTACASCDVEPLIVIITNKPVEQKDSLFCLNKALSKQSKYQVQYYTNLKWPQKQDKEIAETLAKAKYIFSDQVTVVMSGLETREETEFYFIPERAFYLYKRGRLLSQKLKWKQKFNELKYDINFTMSEMPSEETFLELANSLKKCPDNISAVPGSSITDVLFDEEFVENAKKELKKLCPEAGDRKIILYMPTIRNRAKFSKWAQLFDIELLSKLISDKYYMVTELSDFDPSQYYNTVEVAGFSKNLTDKMSVRQLIVAADIIIGDYRDSFFETTLLNKPAFSTASDFEEIQKNANIFHDFSKINPFPILGSEDDLVKQLNSIDSYDFTQLHEFRNRFLKNCDGKTTSRIMEIINNE